MYGVNYVGNNFILIEKNPELAIFLHLFSQIRIYMRREETN